MSGLRCQKGIYPYPTGPPQLVSINSNLSKQERVMDGFSRGLPPPTGPPKDGSSERPPKKTPPAALP
jgi:hypothetical protein